MSKRKSSSQGNTLFNYFQSPPNIPAQPDLKVKSEKFEKKMNFNSDSDDEPIASYSKKRSRLNVLDSDSENENVKSLANTTPKSVKGKIKRLKLNSDSEQSDEDTPIKANKSAKTALRSFTFEKSGSHLESFPNTTPKSTKEEKIKNLKLESGSERSDEDSSGKPAKSSKAALQSFVFQKTDSPKPQMNTSHSLAKGVRANDGNVARWTHEKLDFLKPDKIRDINKLKPTDPDYDARTLYVPPDYLNKLSPAMRQWWILKSGHMDTVLFFKVGKFYELYHMDATVGVNHLGFSYMKGEFAHSGFPESAYGRMVSSLIEQGFKVARIEQTETPEMMAERCKLKKATKFDKVVNREICEISMKGMCVYGAQLLEARQALPSYMLAISEKKKNEVSSRFGICFVDTSIGVFHLGEFDDDMHCSKLLALLVQHPPALVLTERSRLVTKTSDILKRNLGNVRRDVLSSESQFYSANTTIEKLMKACYFKDKNDEFHWPPVLRDLISDGTFKPEFELAMKALGACTWYLQTCELDIKVMAMGKFENYCPVDMISGDTDIRRDYMVLDAITINNLNLLGGVGTLQRTLDHCQTAFGKRLLQQWICRPLCNVSEISHRQEAVMELVRNTDKLEEARAILKKLPDLERQIAKIHIFGNRFCAAHHPDSRAVFYEAKTYSKRKIFDLLSTLRGFEKARAISSIFRDCESRLLQKITQHNPEGAFIDLSETLQYFENAFDQTEAEKEGKIIPQVGIDDDYDRAEMQINEINSELQEYLERQRKFFGCQVTYFGSDKKRFQLEIIDSKCHKVTNEYRLEGTKRGSKPCKRYSTSTTKELLIKMLKAESDRAKIVQDLNRRIFEKFSERRQEWESVINCLTTLDVLCSLAEYARTYSQDVCIPKVLPFSEEPVIKIEGGRHPCIIGIENFVPNDTILGTEANAGILLLTGPNMGGKSTLMRQVTLISLMSQIGSYVPAVSCEVSVTDRIFTRLGAQDDILKHQSTFLVEMMEAAMILQHASKHSFVLLDELGRGTSTHDGNAIATAYVEKLTKIKCRTIFSTHYHSLVEHFVGRKDIQLGHMACMVENEGDLNKENITFLYKFADGVCPKSYGFNVAKLAGLPPTIIRRAFEVARNLETVTRNRKTFAKLFASDAVSIRETLAALP